MHKKILLLLGACAALAACGGGGPSSGSPGAESTIAFEPLSPPLLSSDDVLAASHGDTVITGERISRDGGVTWAPNPGRPLGAVIWKTFVGPTIAVMHTINAGLVRWELATDQAIPIAGAPAYAENFRYHVATDTIFAFDPQLNALSRHRDGVWTAATLPLPAPDACCPYIGDIDTNGDVALLTSSWGVHRSLDGGVTWELVPGTLDVNSRDVMELPDGRFLIAGGITTPIYDATGLPSATPAGPALPGNLGDRQVCGDGAIVIGTNVTVDLGATIQPLVELDGPAPATADAARCGGGRFYAHIELPGFRRGLARIDALGAEPVVIGGWEEDADPSVADATAPLARAGDGTLFVNGMSWRPGDERWRLRGLLNGVIASAPSGAVYGFDATARWRSDDGGDTWSTTPTAPIPPQYVFVTDGGTMYGGRTDGDYIGGALFNDSWIYRSDDDGVSWTEIYKGTRIRDGDGNFTGDAHVLIGLDPGGALVGHDGVSGDDGVTWQASAVGESAVHVTPSGDVLAVALTGDVADDYFHVYGDAGLAGLRTTIAMTMGGVPVRASGLRYMVFDKDGYGYVATGSPHIKVWRSASPIR